MSRLNPNVNLNVSVPAYVKFVIGGISGVTGQIATHPLDVLKVNMQVSQNNLRDAVSSTFSKNGIRGFYAGLSAALLRQVTYSTTRLGTYTTLLDIGEQHFGRLNYVTMIGLGMVAGVIGSFLGTPSDLILIRMITDANLPPEKRKNYRNAISGIIDIWKTEGYVRLWRGAVPTMGRAALVNGTLLSTYTRTKMILLDTGYFRDDILSQFVAAMVSGIVTSVVSLPVDAAKTRIQNWKEFTKPPSVAATIINMIRTEGVVSLWRGFLPYCSRAGPNTIITMVCVDQLHQTYFKYSLRL